MKVVFMGTPEFAVPTLRSLIAAGHEVVAIYTKEPKPAGRGYAEMKSRVHQIALELGIPVYTPKNFRSEESVLEFTNLHADIAVVAAYGLLLPSAILRAPKYGCINVHPSLLPRWRGAAPLQRTIFSGDKESAVCIMQMNEGMDTGDILYIKKFPIIDTMMVAELHDFCANLGGQMIIDVLQQIENGTVMRVKQEEDGATHAAKITKLDEKLEWSRDARQLHCQVKALSPRPGAYFSFDQEVIKVISADFTEDNHSYEPGTVVDDKLTIACAKGFLKPTLLQREGRKMIYLDAFLRGFAIKSGDKLC